MLCCYFLAKYCWEIKEREEIMGLGLCCKSRGKEGRKEGNSYGVEKAFLAAKCLSETCSVTVKALLNVWMRYGRHRRSKSRVCWLRTGTLSSSMNVWSWSSGEWSVNVSRKCCPGMKWLDVWAKFGVAVDIAKVEGDLKLFLYEADWIHLIHNQLGTLRQKE